MRKKKCSICFLFQLYLLRVKWKNTFFYKSILLLWIKWKKLFHKYFFNEFNETKKTRKSASANMNDRKKYSERFLSGACTELLGALGLFGSIFAAGLVVGESMGGYDTNWRGGKCRVVLVSWIINVNEDYFYLYYLPF